MVAIGVVRNAWIQDIFEGRDPARFVNGSDLKCSEFQTAKCANSLMLCLQGTVANNPTVLAINTSAT